MIITLSLEETFAQLWNIYELIQLVGIVDAIM